MTDQMKDLPEATPNTASAATHNDTGFAELSELIKADLPASSDAQLEARLDAELKKEFSATPLIEPPTKRRHPFFKFIGVLLLLLIITGIGAGFWVRTNFYQPVVHDENQTIIVQQGMSTQAIIGKLQQIGIVKNPTVFALYVRALRRSGHLKAGVYKFDSPISPMQAIEKMLRGEVTYERVTIPEGYNRFDIARTLAKVTGKASEQEFLRLMNDTRPIAKFAPQARNLEGYLFADTYNYNAGTSAEELIQLMVNRFKEVFTPEWSARASQLGMTVHQIVTYASIIEKEARVEEDRPKISSVIKNRLKARMPLACDPTFIYAAILAGDYDGNPNQPRHRQRLSPYNTYIYAGLPPGPIASPSRASLEAALYPPDTDYLYFVANGIDGRHIFSSTVAEHEAAVAEYRRNLRQQR
ncbi:MAG: endolytic transglycosylase MltG [Acidobacteria bacterium]|nr:endolytic transglycosylase MltG [Acidobacteriota bacterium]